MKQLIHYITYVILLLAGTFPLSAQTADSTALTPVQNDSLSFKPVIADSNLTVAPKEFRRAFVAGEVAAFFNDTALQLNVRERFVTNALRVFNNKQEAVTFTMEIVAPQSWKLIGNTEKEYTLSPGDSLVIPVRLIPGTGTSEVSSVNVQALLVSNEQELLADAVFGIHRKRIFAGQLPVKMERRSTSR